jgi:hypothetical protein
MSLRIRRLKLVVVTDKGDFGADIKFPDGLVLFRADNTSGKSTCLKAIVYALGLERMFGPANQPPLTPALTSLLEEGIQEHSVIESQVYLEIENRKSERLTIQRQVTGPETRDWRLVTVWEGAVLDATEPEKPGNDYFVRDPGSATRAAGFHARLAEFVGWTLPEVMKYDGTVVPLYMETILPLLYVEQRHGWSSIQATTPRFLQIRDIEKKAVEFTLLLDACVRDVERQRVAQEELETRKVWHLQREECELLANSQGGTVRNLPADPIAKWPPEVSPLVEVYRDNKPVTLRQAIQSHSDKLKKIEEEEIPTAEQAVTETETQLHGLYEKLTETELLESDLYDDIELEENELRGLNVRLGALDEDLKKNQDLQKLRGYGATGNLKISTGHCPTCHQSTKDSLLNQQQEGALMTVEENVEYIRSQIQTFNKMRSRSMGSVKAKQRRLEAAQNRAAEFRTQIRVLKRTLVTDGRVPSLAAVRERVTLEEQIERLTAFEEKFTGKLGVFDELAARWRAIQAKKKNLAAEVLTDSDKAKLRKLEELFVELEVKFGFDSFPTAKLSISRENYRPTREGFDLVYDVSASDNIRTICAYLLALLEVARTEKTNHPGLLILDEPRQQNLFWTDFTEVLARAATAKASGQQIIIATSDTVEGVDEIEKRTGCAVLSFSEKKILSRLYR